MSESKKDSLSPSRPKRSSLKMANMLDPKEIMSYQKKKRNSVSFQLGGNFKFKELRAKFEDIKPEKKKNPEEKKAFSEARRKSIKNEFALVKEMLKKEKAIENIRYGNLSAKDEDCYEAAKEVNALNLLQKEDKFLEEQKLKKSTLSGGEKQKLAFARICLKNPPILLLDEPTSALDKESELDIQKSLDKLSINKTTIQIAHRLNTIENYDKIIVFDKGRIYEQGTHEELMKLKKRYYTLYQYSNFS